MKRLPVLCVIYNEAAEKLLALQKIRGASMGELHDIAGICLEQGVLEIWESYRVNPKYAQLIKNWEAEKEVAQ